MQWHCMTPAMWLQNSDRFADPKLGRVQNGCITPAVSALVVGRKEFLGRVQNKMSWRSPLTSQYSR